MEKQERAEYIGSGMSGCLMPLPWKGRTSSKGQGFSTAMVELGVRGFPRRTRVGNPYSADVAMPTGEGSLDGNHRVTEGQGAHL